MLGVEKKLTRKYVTTGQMNLVFHPVLNHGDYSFQAHLGAECASDQGQFWPFREYLFQNFHRIWKRDARQIVKELGAEFGLESSAFDQCMDQQTYAARLNAQDTLRLERGVRFQPTFHINENEVRGMAMFTTLDGIIKSELGIE